MMVSSLPHPPLRDGDILILESSNHWGESFFSSYGRAGPYGEHSDNGNQRCVCVCVSGGGGGCGHNSGQNNYHTIAFCFQGKATFIVTFKEEIVFIFTSLVLKGHMLTVV